MKTNSFISFIGSIKGCQFASVSYSVDARLKKTGNPYRNDDVRKVTTMSVYVNADYENGVNRRLENNGKEGNFSAESMRGAEWVEGFENKICVSKEGLRLRLYRHKNSNPVTTYLINGRLATDEETKVIKQFLPTKSVSLKQSEAGLAEDEQVTPFSIYIHNLISFTCNHKVFEFKGEEVVESAEVGR